jgi:hypothetical protein
MPIALHIVGTDGLGRPLGRVLGDADSEDAAPVHVLPGKTRFKVGDRHVVKTPYKVAKGEPPRDPLGLSDDLTHVGSAVAPEDAEPLPAMAAGDVVVADDSLGCPEGGDGVAVHLVGKVAVLGRADGVEAAAALAGMGARRDDGGRPGGPRTTPFVAFVSIGALEYEAAAQRAMAEKDTALIAAWLGDDGKIETKVLAHTGGYLFFEYGQNGDSCEDTGLPVPDAPGLHALLDGKFWSSQDWESGVADAWGLEGDLKEVSPEEAAGLFGFADVAALRDAVDDAYPYAYEGDVLEAIRKPVGGEENAAAP